MLWIGIFFDKINAVDFGHQVFWYINWTTKATKSQPTIYKKQWQQVSGVLFPSYSLLLSSKVCTLYDSFNTSLLFLINLVSTFTNKTFWSCFWLMEFSGSCKCDLNNLVIGTIRSGRTIQGKSEWNVVVTNTCSNCTQSSIKLQCIAFQTLVPIDPSIVTVRYNTCLLINGRPLPPSGTVNFSYVWDPPFLLRPTRSTVGPCN